jgi:hypothetical protein
MWAVGTFDREPGEAYRRPDFVRIATQPRGVVAPVEHADGEITLCDDGSGRITGLPHDVWTFSVSGYRVLPRWLEARVGLQADFALVRELRDICGRIAELIDLFAQADIVLEATLNEKTVFPNMTKWLPEEDAAQLRFEFDQEMERLRRAA